MTCCPVESNRLSLALQIGGNHQDLLSHIQDVRLCPEFGDDIDMKLARSAGAESAQAITESHFDSIHVSICKVRANVPDPGQHYQASYQFNW